MKKYLLFICFQIVILVLVISCSTDNPSDNSELIKQMTIKDDYSKLNISQDLKEENLIGYMKISESESYTSIGIGKPMIAKGINSWAVFRDKAGNFIDAGNLLLNDDEVTKIDNNNDGNTRFCYYKSYKQMLFDEENYNWKLSGNSDFNAFEINIAAPKSIVRFTNISVSQKISRQIDLAVNWSGIHNKESNFATIEIVSNIKFLKSDSTGDYYNYDSKKIYIEDTGSYTILSSIFQPLKSGKIWLRIIVGRQVTQELTQGKYVIAEVYSMHEMECELEN